MAMKLIAPWINYYREVEALFKNDDYVRVLYDDEKKEYRQADEDDVDKGTYRAIRVDETTGMPVKDAKGLPTYGFYVTLSLDHPSVLAGNKTYTVPIEIRYEYQNVDTNGNILNLSTTVYK